MKDEIAGFREIPSIEQLPPDFGEKLISDHEDCLRELEKELFQNAPLTEEICDGLKLLAKLMHTQQWFHPDHFSGLVVAGYGEAEPFPSVYIYNIGTIASGRLRWVKSDEAHVNRKHPVIVIPFAQTDMIDLFCSGIFPSLKDRLAEIIAKCLPPQKTAGKMKSSVRDIEKNVREIIEREFQKEYTLPLISAVEALSRYDLARMAEALVSLTAFKARMSVEQQETVGGPIDVAVISRGEGFAWVKRKSPMEAEDAVSGFLIR